MALLNTESSWGWPAKLLHWAIALLVLGMLALGFFMVWAVDDPLRAFRLYQIHKSFGVLVLALLLLRILWRLANHVPDLPASLRPWERATARATHLALYLCLLAMAATGWIMVSSSPLGIPTLVFGLFALPHPIPANAALSEAMETVHGLLAALLVVLVVLHVGGALRHHLVLKDDVLRRMLPERSRRRPTGRPQPDWRR